MRKQHYLTISQRDSDAFHLLLNCGCCLHSQLRSFTSENRIRSYIKEKLIERVDIQDRFVYRLTDKGFKAFSREITPENFRYHSNSIEHDIALIHLSSKVPESVAKPVLPMPPALDVTAAEVSNSSVTMTTVGFGKTIQDNNYSSGVKYKTNPEPIAYCPLKGTQSSNCHGYYYAYGNYSKDYAYAPIKSDGFIYFDAARTGTCSGLGSARYA